MEPNLVAAIGSTERNIEGHSRQERNDSYRVGISNSRGDDIGWIFAGGGNLNGVVEDEVIRVAV
jgi:hypothetical protein